MRGAVRGASGARGWIRTGRLAGAGGSGTSLPTLNGAPGACEQMPSFYFGGWLDIGVSYSPFDGCQGKQRGPFAVAGDGGFGGTSHPSAAPTGLKLVIHAIRTVICRRK